MTKRRTKCLIACLLLTMAAACDDSGASSDEAAYRAEVLEWREGRLARLKAPSGYLNQIGFYWLAPGNHSFGAADSNDVVFNADSSQPILDGCGASWPFCYPFARLRA